MLVAIGKTGYPQMGHRWRKDVCLRRAAPEAPRRKCGFQVEEEWNINKYNAPGRRK